jgi:hypothetical protein
MKVYALFLIISLFTCLNATGQVWETVHEWNTEWEIKYSEWMASDAVYNKMFKDEASPYAGIEVDCADVTYTFRAIFAYENGLKYKVKNPVYNPRRHRYKYWTNEIKKWNRYPEGLKRFLAFVDFINSSLGSETLMYNDTYPIQVSRVRPGDLFGQKIDKDGSWLRHVYQLKGITSVGNFDVMYSNQQKLTDGLPMHTLYNFRLSFPPTEYLWGFKRFRNPVDVGKKISSLNKTSDFSLNQYEMAKNLDPKKFFEWVRSLIKMRDETPQEVVERNLNYICEKTNERVGSVISGVKYRSKINNRCMNFKEYDIYSTPARDDRLYKSFKTFALEYAELENNGMLSQVDARLALISEAILKSSTWTHSEEQLLYEFCSVEIDPDQKLHLAEIYQRFEKNQISSHPNDTFEHRWGEKTDTKKTRCKKWY